METCAVTHPDCPLQVDKMINRAILNRKGTIMWLLEKGYTANVGKMVIREGVPKHAAIVRTMNESWKGNT